MVNVIINLGGRMNTFLIILFVVIILIIVAAIIYICLSNKFTESIIRIQEAEVRMDNNIREKYDLLCKLVALSKNIIKLEEKKFSELNMLKAMKMSSFDTNRTLIKNYNEFLVLYNDNIKLREDDEIYKANKQIELIDEELETLMNYYNANVLSYNRMVKKIPTNIVALIRKFKERPCFDLKDMNDDDYEDFKL